MNDNAKQFVKYVQYCTVSSVSLLVSFPRNFTYLWALETSKTPSNKKRHSQSDHFFAKPGIKSKAAERYWLRSNISKIEWQRVRTKMKKLSLGEECSMVYSSASYQPPIMFWKCYNMYCVCLRVTTWTAYVQKVFRYSNNDEELA